MSGAAAEVTRAGALDMQVCVPKGWKNAEVVAFANLEYPCGTSWGWQIRRKKRLLAGCPVRNPCAEKSGHVHITLDA